MGNDRLGWILAYRRREQTRGRQFRLAESRDLPVPFVRHRKKSRLRTRQLGGEAHKPMGKVGQTQNAVDLARQFDQCLCLAAVLFGGMQVTGCFQHDRSLIGKSAGTPDIFL